MSPKVSLIIEIILHATEDVNKIENALQNIFDINTEDLEKEEMTGHFGNLITILKTKLSKNMRFPKTHQKTPVPKKTLKKSETSLQHMNFA